MDQEELASTISTGGYVFKTPQQGAATSVLVATSPRLEGVGGRYFEDCHQAHRHVPGTPGGVADHALDPDAAARLWQASCDLLAASAHR